ncbi:serine/threonine-protein kinase [Streptomyces sp. B8F3]|uniref:serine/threonine-protein kinase n=1 Tax=Streptomyces sp. B8F3 TaxID=3153573 RepID=UPI00325E5559
MEGIVVDGRYRLAEQTGVGGVGEIRRARDCDRGDEVAIQLLSVTDEAGQAAQARFDHTAEMLAGLDSPYLTSVRGHGITDLAGRVSCGYLVLEPLTGRPLGELQAETGRIGWRQAMAVAEQVCTALAAVHDAGLVHGSLQAASVLIDNAAEAVTVTVLDAGLTDFASATDEKEGVPATGRVLYLAPERGDGAPAKPPGDLYALGALMYELLVGRPPYTGTVAEVREQHRESLPIRPSRVRDLPVEVDDLVFTLMAREPADRPPSAAEAAAAIAGLRTCAPPSSADASAAPTPPSDSGRREEGPRTVEPAAAQMPAPAVKPGTPSAATPQKRWGRRRRVLMVCVALLLAVGGVGGYLGLTAYDQAEVEHAVDRAVQQLNSTSANREVPLSEEAERALDDNSGWLRLRTSDARTTVSSGPEGDAVVIEVTNLLGQHHVCMRIAEVIGPALTASHSPGGC